MAAKGALRHDHTYKGLMCDWILCDYFYVSCLWVVLCSPNFSAAGPPQDVSEMKCFQCLCSLYRGLCELAHVRLYVVCKRGKNIAILSYLPIIADNVLRMPEVCMLDLMISKK
jgi:hypothetical protein